MSKGACTALISIVFSLGELHRLFTRTLIVYVPGSRKRMLGCGPVGAGVGGGMEGGHYSQPVAGVTVQV